LRHNGLLTQKNFRVTVDWMNTQTTEQPPNENIATLENIRDVLAVLRNVTEALEESIEKMNRLWLNEVTTTNYKSSGRNAADLLRKFAAGLPGAVTMQASENAAKRLLEEASSIDAVIVEKREQRKGSRKQSRLPDVSTE
jgi:hypothetical protein